MKEEKKITKQDIVDARVSLRSFMGMHPRVWLPGLLVVLAFIVLIAVLTLPGITKNGTWYILSSTPSGSAVYADRVYIGSTPGSFFIPRGNRTLRISHPGFTAEERNLRVGGRIFATLLFPRRESISFDLGTDNPAGFLASAFSSFAGYGLVGNPTAIYQIPLVLSEAILSLAESGNIRALDGSAIQDFVGASLAASGSPQSVRDALRSTFLAASGGIASPLGLLAGIEVLGAALSGKPQIASLITAYSPQTDKQTILASASLRKLAERAGRLTATGNGLPSSSPGSIRVASRTFIRLPASAIVASGESPSGIALPYELSVPAFALAHTETTRAHWSAFLAANPEWRYETRESLIAKSLADEAYLADWNDSSIDSSSPVTGVSRYAAEAYCRWLTSFAPSGMDVILPSEAMWETAIRASSADWKKAVLFAPGRAGPSHAGSTGTDRLGFADLAGNVWEWCSDSFLPFPAFSPYNAKWLGAEFSVRGASWANSIDAVSPASRGGFPASFSSPFLGFRPALVQR